MGRTLSVHQQRKDPSYYGRAKTAYKSRNHSIDIFRFIAALLVVSIHVEPFLDQNLYLGYFCSKIITRIAVPFFFSVSGYYFNKSIECHKNWKCIFIKYLKYYLFWSALYFSFDIIQKCINNEDINILNYCIRLFFLGAEYHLWYFIALLLCVLLFGLFQNNNRLWTVISLALYFIGVLIFSYTYVFFNKNSVLIQSLLQNEYIRTARGIVCLGIPFFYLGIYLSNRELVIQQKRNWKRDFIVVISTAIFYFAEILIIKYFNFAEDIITTIGLLPLCLVIVVCLLRYPLFGYLKRLNTISFFCKSSSSFIYCVHPLWIILISSFIPTFNELTNFVKYISVIMLCIVAWFLILILNKRFLNPIVNKYLLNV